MSNKVAITRTMALKMFWNRGYESEEKLRQASVIIDIRARL
jgi:hypothetical protein